MPDQPLYTEKKLMQLAAAGDENAFTQLFHLYRNKLYSYTLRITASPEQAQDMVQDVFLKLWKNRGQLDKLDNFSAFIFKLAQNQAINAFKRMATENIFLQKKQQQTEAYKSIPEENIDYKQVQHLVNDALKKLPQQQQLVFKLSREQGLKHHEIATALKISPFTVKNHLVLALNSIRQHLRNNELERTA